MNALTAALVFRHLLFFVVINDQPTPPRLLFDTRQYYVYSDALRVTAYDQDGTRRLQAKVGVGGRLDQAPTTPTQPLYLVEADPGMNGATPQFDRPWALVASANHTLGANGPGPALYFYAPPGCREFTVGAQAVSPNEGGRVMITDPEGKLAAVLDGELDQPQKVKVAVPEGLQDHIWVLTWAKPETAPAALNDLNIWLDGELTPLLFPEKAWAEKYGKTLWERDRAAREGE